MRGARNQITNEQSLWDEIEHLRAENARLQDRLRQQEEDSSERKQAAVVAVDGPRILLPGSRMEHLQPELLMILLEYCGVGLALKMTICSKTLRESILQSKYWVHIDFHASDNTISRPELTDNVLSNILTRINARNVTQSLSLRYCRRIQGHGLEPLMHSDVLERIDLRNTYADTVHMGAAVNVLVTMLYRQLYEVKVTYDGFYQWIDYQQWPSVINRDVFDPKRMFIQSLRKAKVERAIQQATLCHSCSEPVVDKSRQTVSHRLGLQELHCSTCHRKYCRKFTCPTEFTECFECGDSHCQDCISSKQCKECARWYCATRSCISVHTCDDCKQHICDHCYICIQQCPSCQSILCIDCADESNSKLLRCDKCSMTFCGKDECRTVQHCLKCDKNYCYDCGEFVDDCVSCGIGHCLGHCAVDREGL